MIAPDAGLTDDEIRAVADPLVRAQILRRISRANRTLTGSQSRIWTDTVAELAGDGLDERKPNWIARKVGVSAGRIRQILIRARRMSRPELVSEGAPS